MYKLETAVESLFCMNQNTYTVYFYKCKCNVMPDHATKSDSYLQESQLVQEGAEVGDDFGARYELLPHVVVENQI